MGFLKIPRPLFSMQFDFGPLSTKRSRAARIALCGRHPHPFLKKPTIKTRSTLTTFRRFDYPHTKQFQARYTGVSEQASSEHRRMAQGDRIRPGWAVGGKIHELIAAVADRMQTDPETVGPAFLAAVHKLMQAGFLSSVGGL